MMKQSESEAAMKITSAVAVLILGLALPALGQDKTSCKAFFQVLRADTQTPENLRAGMDAAQKKWWESQGQKKYSGLCLNGSVSTGEKPRYLVIWARSGSIHQTAVATGEVYGQKLILLQGTAPKEWIYRPRWDTASLSILNVAYESNLEIPHIHMAAGWPYNSQTC
jgi:hypothetical protein